MGLLGLPSRGLAVILLFGIAAAASVSGREGPDPKDCQRLLQETKECPFRDNWTMHEDESENFTLQYDATLQLIFFRCDPQTGKKEERAIGRRMNLYNYANETGVFLIKQMFMVKNAKKRHEGLYILSLLKEGTCLAQIYLTVLDPPPSVDVTSMPNMNISVTGSSPVSRRRYGLYIALGLLAVVFIIAVAVIVFHPQPNWIKCLKRNSSTCKYAAPSPSGSTTESGLVMNGFGQHQPQESHLDSLNQNHDEANS